MNGVFRNLLSRAFDKFDMTLGQGPKPKGSGKKWTQNSGHKILVTVTNGNVANILVLTSKDIQKLQIYIFKLDDTTYQKIRRKNTLSRRYVSTKTQM